MSIFYVSLYVYWWPWLFTVQSAAFTGTSSKVCSIFGITRKFVVNHNFTWLSVHVRNWIMFYTGNSLCVVKLQHRIQRPGRGAKKHEIYVAALGGHLFTTRKVWGKVIFLHLSVILFMGGWYPSMHCRWYPSIPCSRSPGGGGVVSQHAL